MKNNKYYRVYAEINLDAIVKNVDNLMALTKENTGALRHGQVAHHIDRRAVIRCVDRLGQRGVGLVR